MSIITKEKSYIYIEFNRNNFEECNNLTKGKLYDFKILEPNKDIAICKLYRGSRFDDVIVVEGDILYKNVAKNSLWNCLEKKYFNKKFNINL